MAGLFIAHQIASAAYIEIVARQLESCTQSIKIAQHLEALVGGLGEHLIWRGLVR